MTTDSRDTEQFTLVESAGPWPFVTRRRYLRPDGSHHVWESRPHRKALLGRRASTLASAGTGLLRCLWNPRELNWWIGAVFALGSLLFMLGSLLILMPGLAQRWSFEATGINAIFFAGSIPFTTAAGLQLLQAANAGDPGPHGSAARQRTVWFGWRPHDAGWLSCALQFAGTVLFNINTFDAMLPGLNWIQQDLAIWAPDVAGSILFLISGYLAFAEAGHAHFSWRPTSLSWWITVANLLGCVAFMISAVYAFVPVQTPGFDAAEISVAFTFVGAAGFLIGSLLLLPETAIHPDP